MTKPMTGNLEALLKSIRGLYKGQPIIVAISGFCGSGKSTLSAELQERLAGAAHVPGDAFMVDRLNRRTDDWDTIDRTRIIEQVLKPVREGKDINYQVYDWDKNEAREWREVPHPQFLLLEGIGTIHPDIIPYLDYIVWVERSQEEAAIQGIRRDHEERHDAHDDLWHNFLIPNDRDYFAKHQPKEKADFIYTATRTVN
jgi:uridine kinase